MSLLAAWHSINSSHASGLVQIIEGIQYFVDVPLHLYFITHKESRTDKTPGKDITEIARFGGATWRIIIKHDPCRRLDYRYY